MHNEHFADVRRFGLEVRLIDGAERHYDYRRNGDHAVARMTTREMMSDRVRQSDTAAIEAVRNLLAQIAPSPRMAQDELLQRSRNALHLNDASIERIDVEVEFSDGATIDAKTHKGLRDSWRRHAELSSLP